MRTFRFLAFGQIAFSVLLIGSAALAGFGAFLGTRDKSVFVLLFTVSLLGLLALLALTIYRSAVAHLRKPSQRTALIVAMNSAVFLWFLLTSVVNASRDPRSFEPLYAMVTLGVAYLAYRLLLKPAACRTFPANAQNA